MIQIEVTDEFDKWLKGLRDLQAKERILSGFGDCVTAVLAT
jgi:putative component of toxin-antitoxin plasmid stabilization module